MRIQRLHEVGALREAVRVRTPRCVVSLRPDGSEGSGKFGHMTGEGGAVKISIHQKGEQAMEALECADHHLANLRRVLENAGR
mmetsp:Transcript_46717/g.123984  ORF Transcript_46717/g.123984 Transcript_46717/m.123984 type:complete len:83 (+) Transcript_46717:172-420(+)